MEYYTKKDLNKLKKHSIISLYENLQERFIWLENSNRSLSAEVVDIKNQFSKFKVEDFFKKKI